MTQRPRALPARPSLDQQKKRARELLNAFRGGDADALDRFRLHLPDKQRISLADAQYVIACEYGFQSWRALTAHIDTVLNESHEPVLNRFRRAVDEVDVAGLRRLLNGGARDLVNVPIFPFDSPAIVHAAGGGDVEVINTLLEFGADPNARSRWWAGGFHPLHSAQGAVADRLISAGSRMDACAAAHLDRSDELVRLLDAEPGRVHERGGDGQTPLHFARSREVVDILLDRGADIDARDVDHRATAAEWMLERGRGRYGLARYLVERGASADIFLAAALGLTDRLRALIDEDPSRLQLRTGEGHYGEAGRGSLHIYTWTIGSGLLPLQVAMQFGHEAAVELLMRNATEVDRFITACARGDTATAERLLAGNAGLIDNLPPRMKRMLPDAAWHGNTAAVDLMLRLGFDAAARGQDGGTVLHCAAWQGWAECVRVALRYEPVRALIEDRDSSHDSTALGWCFHGASHRRNPAGDYASVTKQLLEAGARVGPNASDAPAELLALARDLAW